MSNGFSLTNILLIVISATGILFLTGGLTIYLRFNYILNSVDSIIDKFNFIADTGVLMFNESQKLFHAIPISQLIDLRDRFDYEDGVDMLFRIMPELEHYLRQQNDANFCVYALNSSNCYGDVI